MKALKSQLAKQLLADPMAKGELHKVLATKTLHVDSYQRTSAIGRSIEVKSRNGKILRVEPKFVGKAA